MAETPSIPGTTLQRIRHRGQEIVGKPYRLSEVDRDAIRDEVHDTTNKLRLSIVPNAQPIPVEHIPDIMYLMHPFGPLWERIMGLSMQVMGPASDVPLRDMKLALLRTGWLLQAPFEFGEHVAQARKLGFSAEEIEAICEEGSTAKNWTEHEAAVLSAAEELRANAMIGDATWAVLAKSYTEKQLLELIIVIGQFTTVGYYQNSLRIPLPADNEGLFAR